MTTLVSIIGITIENNTGGKGEETSQAWVPPHLSALLDYLFTSPVVHYNRWSVWGSGSCLSLSSEFSWDFVLKTWDELGRSQNAEGL